MKKADLEVGMAVEVKFDGGVADGVLMEKGTYRATVELGVEKEDEAGKEVMENVTVSIPYKDVLGLLA